MVKNKYVIVDNFQAKRVKVLVLDSDYEFGNHSDVALIDGEAYCFTMGTEKNWVLIESQKDFAGKPVEFVRLCKGDTMKLHAYCGETFSHSRYQKEFLAFLEKAGWEKHGDSWQAHGFKMSKND